MQQLFNYSDDGNFLPGGPIFPNPKEASLFLPLAPQVDFYVPLRKRSSVTALFPSSEEIFEEKKPASIEVLPDECLFEIFRHLSGGEEKISCACVSKRWLMLLSTIRRDEICTKKVVSSIQKEKKSNKSDMKSKGNEVKDEVVAEDVGGDGYLSRSLEGKKATDIRLAAIAVGTSHRGGLGKLSIRGTNSTKALSNLGLKAIARSCTSLRVLSLWNLSSVGDEGLCEIANECPLLEKLDLCRCPAITDKSLLVIARKCPNLTSITIDSCCKIGDQCLQALGSCCRILSSVSIRKCPLVGDQGIAGLLSSASGSLTKLKLQALNISDMSLAVIGHYGKVLTNLALCGLQNVGERGFWVMGSAKGLQALKSFTINSCQGVTDLGLEALGKGCPNLKQFCLLKSAFLSDKGLVSFGKSAPSLESLKLEGCHGVTQFGFFGFLLNSGEKLKAIAMANCLGYKEFVVGFPAMKVCTALQHLSIHNCPGFGNVSVSILGKLCPNLQSLDLDGLNGISDEGLLPLIENCERCLSKVNLRGCVNLTDKVVSVIANLHGLTLELLNLDGCKYISDVSLAAIAEHCSWLCDLDVSECAITDSGISALARGCQLGLQIFSASGCPFISDKSLSDFLKLGQTLAGLNIQQCKGISSSTVDVLMECLWKCDILS